MLFGGECPDKDTYTIDVKQLDSAVWYSGVPLDEMLDAAACANTELSRMLQDLATEREAAGRDNIPIPNGWLWVGQFYDQ